MVRLLHDAGACLDSVTPTGRCALSCATCDNSSNSVQMVKLLLRLGADVHRCEASHYNPSLHLCGVVATVQYW